MMSPGSADTVPLISQHSAPSSHGWRGVSVLVVTLSMCCSLCRSVMYTAEQGACRFYLLPVNQWVMFFAGLAVGELRNARLAVLAMHGGCEKGCA